MPTTKHELSRMTWKEAEEAFAQNKVFLLPLGSMEEHGPHSVTGDYRAAEEAAKEIAKRTDSVMVPVIPFGYSEYFRSYPGTISFSPETLYKILEDIFDCLLEHGARKFLIVNGHGGNSAIVEMYCRSLRRKTGIMVGKFDIWQVLTPEMKAELFGQENLSKCMGHGAEPVTSVMSYLSPSDIRMDLVGPDDRVSHWQEFEIKTVGKTQVAGVEACVYFDMKDITSQGCLADPHYGSAEIGERIFAQMVAVGCAFVKKIANSEMHIECENL